MLNQIVQAVNASGCFLGHALNLATHLCEPTWAFLHALFDLCEYSDFFFGCRHFDEVGFAVLNACTQQDIQSRVATIIKDQVRPIWEHEGLIKVVPVFFKRLALDRKHRCTTCSNCSRRVVLGGEDVARRPANIRAKVHKRLNQNRRLNGHVQRADDTRTRQRLGITILFT